MKVLFFDVDGTLMDNRGRVPLSARRAIALTQKKGNKVIINSGRCLAGIPKVIRDLKPDGYVCGCGTAVYLDGKTIFHSALPKDLCRKILLENRRLGNWGQMESETTTWMDMRCKNIPVRGALLMMAMFYNSARLVWKKVPEDFQFDKFFIIGRPQADLEQLAEIAGPTMEIIAREHGCAEAVQRDCSKATGMDRICQELGVSLDDCYAFGDSNNDIPMLEHITHSVAMGGLNGDILPYCEYQTTALEDNGIFNALKHYGLI